MKSFQNDAPVANFRVFVWLAVCRSLTAHFIVDASIMPKYFSNTSTAL